MAAPGSNKTQGSARAFKPKPAIENRKSPMTTLTKQGLIVF
jgi:hypothetical protein